MTCIVGLVDSGRVWIGGDSAGVAGLDLTIRADPKVFKNGPYLMGFTSSFRMGQLLQFAFRPPEHRQGMPDFEFMVTRFIDEARRCLKDGGYAKKENETESGGCFLVGYHGALYKISVDYQVGIPALGYDATGCGESFALGAMFATGHLSPSARIALALTAAARFSAGVAPPFIWDSVGSE